MRGGRAPSLPGSDDEPAACEAGSGVYVWQIHA